MKQFRYRKKKYYRKSKKKQIKKRRKVYGKGIFGPVSFGAFFSKLADKRWG